MGSFLVVETGFFLFDIDFRVVGRSFDVSGVGFGFMRSFLIFL